jgi:hypothetical protein
MDKREAKRLGAWISLMGGLCFVAGALIAAYVAFLMKPEAASSFLLRLGRFFH